MTTTTMDPFDVATCAGNRSNVYYGRMEVSAHFVKLEKGIGKTPWNESDGVDIRRTEVHLICNPIEASGLTFLIERKILAESSEWSKIVWPSLRELGLKNLRELHGKWVRVEMQKTGRTYTTKRGETGEETTMRFTAIFEDLATCEAMYWKERGEKPSPETIDMGPGAGQPSVMMVTDNGNNEATPVNDTERNTAKQFLKVLIKQADGDIEKLANLLATMPLVNKYFSITSPEVLEAMEVTTCTPS